MTKKIQITLTLFLLTFVFFVGKVLAQETPEEIAKRYGITFPISELGNCANYSECRNYCEDPVNYDTCIEFAKKKGFYNEEEFGKKDDILASAKGELGCSSESSCRAYCEQEVNFEKCSAFARKHDLSGGHAVDSTEQKFLEKAKEVLGCNSPLSCMKFCDNPENYDKCSEFAKQMGVRGGEHYAGPGGCTSEETCRAFCSAAENYQICASYSSGSGGSFSGPGGCNSEDSCRSYCEKNPQECGAPSSQEHNFQEYCNKTPNCAWTGNTCQCSKIEGIDPDEYCKKYPDRCSREGGDPALECAKYPGCSWNGSKCDCSQQYPESSGSYTPYPTASYNYDPGTECAKQAGCNWTGSTCQCSSSSTPYQSESYPTPTPSVQGLSTIRNLFQLLLQNLLGK